MSESPIITDDHEFFDALYQLWANTTQGYWECSVDDNFGPGVLDIVSEVDSETFYIAAFMADENARFVSGIHTVLPELIERAQEALDRAERWEELYDDAAFGNYEDSLRIRELETEADDLALENERLRNRISDLEENHLIEVLKLTDEINTLERRIK